MHVRRRAMRRTTAAAWVAALTAACTLAGGAAATAAPGGRPDARDSDGVQLERLDRGLVAASPSEGVFLSWRLLGDEVTGHTDTGMAGPAFAVYRGNQRIATVTDSTNYIDPAGTATSRYRVAPVVDGRERDRSDWVTPWANSYLDVPLSKPAGGVTPAGEAYTYSANDASVADLDGDGEY